MHRSLTNVLFVSRDNAGRSLLAEACLRHLGNSKFRAYSCGVPRLVADNPNPWTALALQTAGIPGTELRCKSWNEFTRGGAPKMDFVITLDAETAGDHPIWPGQPETALWAFAPLSSEKPGSPAAGVLAVQTLVSLRRRIELLMSLHQRGSSRTDLRHDLRDMAHL